MSVFAECIFYSLLFLIVLIKATLVPLVAKVPSHLVNSQKVLKRVRPTREKFLFLRTVHSVNIVKVKFFLSLANFILDLSQGGGRMKRGSCICKTKSTAQMSTFDTWITWHGMLLAE